MSLENQVCSLELSKRLKELGVKQESVFCYTSDETENKLLYLPNRNETGSMKPLITYAAFTVAELGELLPWVIEIDNSYIPVRFCKRKDQYGEILYGINYDLLIVEENAEADARAKMLI